MSRIVGLDGAITVAGGVDGAGDDADDELDESDAVKPGVSPSTSTCVSESSRLWPRTLFACP